MTPEERRGLIVHYERARKLASTYERKAEKLRRLLEDGCEHPAEYVVDDKWEHDNGYGVQTMMKSKFCKLCRKTDYWLRGRFT